MEYKSFKPDPNPTGMTSFLSENVSGFSGTHWLNTLTVSPVNVWCVWVKLLPLWATDSPGNASLIWLLSHMSLESYVGGIYLFYLARFVDWELILMYNSLNYRGNSYRGKEGGMNELGMIRWPWWYKGQIGNLARTPGLTPLFLR